MSDRPMNVDSAWSAHLAGETPERLDSETLMSVLERDRTGRREIVADQALHRLMLALPHITETEDDFLGKTLARFDGIDVDDVTSPVSRDRTDAVSTAFVRADADAPVLDYRPLRRRRASFGFQAICATVVAAAAVIGFMLGSRGPVRDGTNEIVDQSSPNNADDRVAAIPDQALAKLVASRDAVWRSPPTGQQIGRGELDLLAGSAELVFADGTTIRFENRTSVRIVDPGRVHLNLGTLNVRVPTANIGFAVVTPTARVIDLGTEFRVAVQDSGETRVELERGDVEVVGIANSRPTARWRLSEDGMRTATVFRTDQDAGAWASTASSKDTFSGEIVLDDRSVAFDSEKNFHKVRQNLEERLNSDREAARRDWAALVAGFSNGRVTLNGTELTLDTMDDVLELPQSIPQADPLSRLTGALVIDGRERLFDSQEEFLRLRRGVLKRLQLFGVHGAGRNVKQPIPAGDDDSGAGRLVRPVEPRPVAEPNRRPAADGGGRPAGRDDEINPFLPKSKKNDDDKN